MEAPRRCGNYTAVVGTNRIKVGRPGLVRCSKFGRKLEPQCVIWTKDHVARQIGCTQVKIAVVEAAGCLIGLIEQCTNSKGHRKEIEQP